MPRLGTEVFKPNTCDDIEYNSKVFVWRLTGEAFESYSDYLARVFECKQRVWNTTHGTHQKLTFEEALALERKSKSDLQQLPDWVIETVAKQAHHAHGPLGSIVSKVASHLKSHFPIGCHVTVFVAPRKPRKEAVVIDVISPAVAEAIERDASGEDASTLDGMANVVDFASLASKKEIDGQGSDGAEEAEGEPMEDEDREGEGEVEETSPKQAKKSSKAKKAKASQNQLLYKLEYHDGTTALLHADRLKHLPGRASSDTVKLILKENATRSPAGFWVFDSALTRRFKIKNKLTEAQVGKKKQKTPAKPKQPKGMKKAERDVIEILSQLADPQCKKQPSTVKKELGEKLQFLSKSAKKKYTKDFKQKLLDRPAIIEKYKEEKRQQKQDQQAALREKKKQMREFWKPREDATLTDHKDMPAFHPLNYSLPTNLFSRVLSVFQFCMQYAEPLELSSQLNYTFNLRDLEQSFSMDHLNDLVTELLAALLRIVLEEEDEDNLRSFLTLKMPLLSLDTYTLSGMLYMYFTSPAGLDFVDESIVEYLKTQEFASLGAEQKLDVVEYFIVKVLQSGRVDELIGEAQDAVKQLNSEWRDELSRLAAQKRERKQALKAKESKDGNDGNDAAAKDTQDADAAKEQEALEKAEREAKEREFKQKVLLAEQPLRCPRLGSDRFRRKYWLFKGIAGVLVEPPPAGMVELAQAPKAPTEVEKKMIAEQKKKDAEQRQGELDNAADAASDKADGQEEGDEGSEQDYGEVDSTNILPLDSWCIISSQEELDALKETLNVRGIRENSLRTALSLYEEVTSQFLTQARPKSCYARGRAPKVEDAPATIQRAVLKELISDTYKKLFEGGMLLPGFDKVQQQWLQNLEQATCPQDLATVAVELAQNIPFRFLRSSAPRKSEESLYLGMEIDEEVEDIARREFEEFRILKGNKDADATIAGSTSVMDVASDRGETDGTAEPQAVVGTSDQTEIDQGDGEQVEDEQAPKAGEQVVEQPQKAEETGISSKLQNEDKAEVSSGDKTGDEMDDVEDVNDVKEEGDEDADDGDGEDGEVQPSQSQDGAPKFDTVFELWVALTKQALSYSEVFQSLYMLEASILWSKSIVRTRCRVCRKGTNSDQLLLCDTCDDGYHMYCLRPKLTSIPEGDWHCPRCQPRTPKRAKAKRREASSDDEDEAQTRRSGRKKSKAVEASSDEEQEYDLKGVQSRIQLADTLLQFLEEHELAEPFLAPVRRRDAPDYYQIIQQPMDFSTMRKKLKRNEYKTLDAFVNDADLVFDNCLEYNGEKHELSIEAEEIRHQFQEKFSELSKLFDSSVGRRGRRGRR
eukprot:m.305219 g.305219  ORF g.305219 m.305219 type:complete len:1320 (+) comp15906_c0_seq6:103-4062(+)